jgi:hypothetical protein
MARRPLLLLSGLAACLPGLCGFVLLSAEKATLPVTPDSPILNFIWDGKAPTIKEKDKFAGGQFKDLDDKAFMQHLLTDALGIWNDVPGAFVTLQVTEEETPGDAKLDDSDKKFSIVVQKSSNLSTAAFAKPKIEDSNRALIADCDVSITDTSSPARDLAFTIAHELGHCLGLGHAHTNYDAIMGYSRTARTLTLGADDMAGLIYLYPDPAYVGSKPKELICGVVGAKPAGDGGVRALAMLTLLAAPLAMAAACGLRAKRSVVV